MTTFTSTSGKWFSRKSQRWRLVCQNPGHAYQKGLINVLLREHGSFHGVQGFTPLILGNFCTSWNRAQLQRWFYVLKGHSAPLHFSSANSWNKRPPPSRATWSKGSRSPKKDMPKESQHASANQAVDGVLHLGGIILTNMGTQGRSVVRSYPQNMVLAGPRGRVTENMALNVATGKKSWKKVWKVVGGL